jgi:hypothetical protein
LKNKWNFRRRAYSTGKHVADVLTDRETHAKLLYCIAVTNEDPLVVSQQGGMWVKEAGYDLIKDDNRWEFS